MTSPRPSCISTESNNQNECAAASSPKSSMPAAPRSQNPATNRGKNAHTAPPPDLIGRTNRPATICYQRVATPNATTLPADPHNSFLALATLSFRSLSGRLRPDSSSRRLSHHYRHGARRPHPLLRLQERTNAGARRAGRRRRTVHRSLHAEPDHADVTHHDSHRSA